MKLAVYGTLRAGSKNTGIVKNSSLVYPGHESFPAVIHNKKGSGTVVEVHNVSEEDLVRYDMYEGISSGLYRRVRVWSRYGWWLKRKSLDLCSRGWVNAKKQYV